METLSQRNGSIAYLIGKGTNALMPRTTVEVQFWSENRHTHSDLSEVVPQSPARVGTMGSRAAGLDLSTI